MLPCFFSLERNYYETRLLAEVELAAGAVDFSRFATSKSGQSRSFWAE